jgi:KUP system potassium uptake protein
MPEEEFLARVEAKHLSRIPGTGAFLTSAEDGIPLPLMNFVRHLQVLHERVLLVTLQSLDVPHASETERVELVPVTPDVTRVLLRFGFADTIHVPRALRSAVEDGRLAGVDCDHVSYFISHETVIASEKKPGMAGWREEIFALMQRNAEGTASYLCVPALQVMEVGAEMEV